MALIACIYGDTTMQSSFFGTDADILQVWRWLFDTPEMRIFESYSVPDQANQWFVSWDDIVECYYDGRSTLVAWPENVGGVPYGEHITFTDETQRELSAVGRNVLHSPAAINVIRNNNQNGCLADTWITSWEEKGIRQPSIFSDVYIDSVDWKAFRSICSAIQRKIKKISQAKLGPAPIMPDAFEKLNAGQIKLWGWGEECDHQSPHVIAIKS
jgi:hypothetical protein